MAKDEPWEQRSNTKQDAFNKEANIRAEIFLTEIFCPAIRKDLSQELGCEVNIKMDEKEKQTVIFFLSETVYQYRNPAGDSFGNWSLGGMDASDDSRDNTLCREVLS